MVSFDVSGNENDNNTKVNKEAKNISQKHRSLTESSKWCYRLGEQSRHMLLDGLSHIAAVLNIN